MPLVHAVITAACIGVPLLSAGGNILMIPITAAHLALNPKPHSAAGRYFRLCAPSDTRRGLPCHVVESHEALCCSVAPLLYDANFMHRALCRFAGDFRRSTSGACSSLIALGVCVRFGISAAWRLEYFVFLGRPVQVRAMHKKVRSPRKLCRPCDFSSADRALLILVYQTNICGRSRVKRSCLHRARRQNL